MAYRATSAAEPRAEPQPAAEQETSARARVTRFRGSASQQAFQLACYLAFAPLTLPAMRVVQKAMLPASSARRRGSQRGRNQHR